MQDLNLLPTLPRRARCQVTLIPEESVRRSNQTELIPISREDGLEPPTSALAVNLRPSLRWVKGNSVLPVDWHEWTRLERMTGLIGPLPPLSRLRYVPR